MNCSVAIYPSKEWRLDFYKWDKYIRTAKQNGFNEVFSTLHLPELGIEEQVDMVEKLTSLVHRFNMDLTVDIGGNEIDLILDNKSLSQRIKDVRIDFIRMDYGFSMEQVKRIYKEWKVRGFVINASTYSENDARRIKESFYTVDSGIELRACHNYYPRPETGLDWDFFLKQNEIFKNIGLPVYACIPGKSNPRLPLRLGLPTLEVHRNCSLERSVAEIITSSGIEGIIAADEFFTEEELKRICSVVRKEPLSLKISLSDNISESERNKILSAVHHIRYDSTCQILRSQTSREMSRIGDKIPAHNINQRKRGMVTIDNENYSRYSGELQIVLEDLESDYRVNCCGMIDESDFWKLKYFRDGYDYKFINY